MRHEKLTIPVDVVCVDRVLDLGPHMSSQMCHQTLTAALINVIYNLHNMWSFIGVGRSGHQMGVG